MSKQRKEQPTSPLKAIRANCLECSGRSTSAVKYCPMKGKCYLWDFRFGRNPFRKATVLTEEQRANRAANLQKARDKISGEKAQ